MDYRVDIEEPPIFVSDRVVAVRKRIKMVSIILKTNPSYIPLNLINMIYGITASVIFDSFGLVIFSSIVSFMTTILIAPEHKKDGVKVVLQKTFGIDGIIVSPEDTEQKQI